jgi:hypothetical protein
MEIDAAYQNTAHSTDKMATNMHSSRIRRPNILAPETESQLNQFFFCLHPVPLADKTVNKSFKAHPRRQVQHRLAGCGYSCGTALSPLFPFHNK